MISDKIWTMIHNYANISTQHIVDLCASQYGFSSQISISRLPGENISYQIITEDGEYFVLKLADSEISSEMIELEYQAVENLIDQGIKIDLPRILPTNSGSVEAVHITGQGFTMRGRLLEFVSGIPWCQAEESNPTQLRNLGQLLGKIDLILNGMDHPAAYRTHQWDLSRAAQHRHKISLINDSDRKKLLEWAFHLYAACALPHLADFPHALIHADANDENILLQSGRISGLLDFGDCIYNPVICELAITLAYIMLDQSNPLHVGAELVAGYHAIHPRLILELTVLFPLVCGRLATTLTIAAERRQIDPNHPNWFVTEERAWALLEQMSAVDPLEAASILAAGTGIFPPYDHGTSPELLLKKRQQHIGPSLSISYRQPIKMVRGEGQYLFDHRGQPYLDLVNNVCHVGHCHPRVVAAGQQQMARLNTNTRYLYDGLTEYAERLCNTLPDPLDTCFFVNSGSEANELALRLAMTYTGRRDFVVLEGAYHGNTSTLIEISPYKFMGDGGRGQPEPWVHIAPMPDGYRGIHKGNSPATGIAYGNEVGRVIPNVDAKLAGFITESLMGCGGQIIPPPQYLETAFQHVRAAGGLCIIDEVQVGFARVGSHFWAFERQEVIPDIVVMGKPIGNGHPMAAVVTKREIAASFNNGMEFFSTFGGNPISCAIGLAVLNVIYDEDLQRHALKMGTHFLNGLENLMNQHKIIGDVRGTGLFIGVELVRDRETLEPAAKEADELIQQMRSRGILLSTDGPYHNVIKIKPPLVLNIDDIDMVLRSFDDILKII
jgi:4-aminobutyrate aminotransferase-like enzyme/Ser/Thr protein kinase RdoA (MazF antagonist)